MSSTLYRSGTVPAAAAVTPRTAAPLPPVNAIAEEAQCLAGGEPAIATRPSGNLIACEQRISVQAPLWNWQDDWRFSAYRRCGYLGERGAPPSPYPLHPACGMERRTMRYRPRKELLGRRADLGILKRVIRQVVIHHDGAESSAECFHILHDERGLSAHFLIDNDGTIYQTLDLADVAFHAQSANACSIGIELCNRGRVELPASEASRRGREPMRVRIHGDEYHTWSFTSAQYQSLIALLTTLLRIFPNLPRAYPGSGAPIYGALENPERFSGVLGHYHLTSRKWDPGCFDFARLLQAVGGHPVWFAAAAPPAAGAPAGALADAGPRSRLLAANEQDADGGFYPVGPCGDDLVWHGGIHLALAAGAPLYSPFPGRLVAARALSRPTATGAADFVLVRYALPLAGRTQTFFLLLYHLDLQSGAPPAWLAHADGARRAQSVPGVVFPDREVLTGELLGRVGVAGPAGASAPQIHVEVLAAQELTDAVAPGAFRVKDCQRAGVVCLDRELHQALGGGGTPALVHRARTDAQAKGRLRDLRRLAVRFPSEWAVLGASEQARLRRESPAFARLSAAQQCQIVAEQLAPHWWLTPEVAEQVGLPPDLLLWHYHPIEFLAWVGELLGQPPAGGAALRLTAPAAGPAEDGAKGDDGYASEEDLGDWDLGVGGELGLEDVARGFPAHWLGSAAGHAAGDLRTR